MKGSMSLRKVSLTVLLIFATLFCAVWAAIPQAYAATDSSTGAYIVPNGESPHNYMSKVKLPEYQAANNNVQFVYMPNFQNGRPTKMTGAIDDNGQYLVISATKGNHQTGSFVMYYPNTAYLSDGTKIDVVLEGDVECEHAVTEDTNVFMHPVNGSQQLSGAPRNGVKITVAVKLYIHGSYNVESNTGRSLDNGVFGIFFSDIDQTAGSSPEWYEAVTLKSGYVEGYMAMGEQIPNASHNNTNHESPSQGGRLDTERLSTHNPDWLVFRATHDCDVMTDSEMAFMVKNNTTFMWSGTNCGTGIGLFGSAATPEFPSQKYVTRGENDFADETYADKSSTVRFTIESKMPYVPDSSVPKSVKVTDTLEPCFNASAATVRVWRKTMDGVWEDATSDWSKSVSGQTLTLTCNNRTAAKGTHQFVILVPFKSNYDFNSLPTVDIGGNNYKHTINNAKVAVTKSDDSEFTRTTQTVDVYLDFDGGVSVQKSSSIPGITNGNSCYSLAGAKYNVYASEADANSGSNSLGTLTTTSTGSSNSLSLGIGTYYLKEVTASPGYALNTAVTSFAVSSGEDTVVRVTEPPKADDVVLSVVKRPSDTSKSYNMAGARFKVEYYNAHLTAAQVATTTPTRVWYIDTANSSANLGVGDMNHNVVATMSDTLYRRGTNANPIIPLGTVAVTEVSAPPGFELGNPATVIYRINDDGSDTALTASRSNVQNYTSGSGYTYSVSNVLAPMSTNTPVEASKSVDKSIATVDEHITYTIKFPVSAPSASGAYRSIAFADVLPRYAAYDEGSFEVYNTNGACVTPCGTLRVTKSGGRDSLRFDFDNTWVADGITSPGDLTFTFTAMVQDPGHTSGYYSLINTATVLVNGASFDTKTVETRVPVWYIDLTKTSTNPVISNSNPNAYSLAGAKFSVKRSDGDIPSPGYIVTDDNGSGSIRVVKPGRYDLQEIVAPKGFAHNDEVKSVTLNSNNYNQHVPISFSNEPLYATRAAQKMDNEYFNIFNPNIDKPFHYEDKSDWQGNVPNFSGVTVRARHFGNYTWSPQHTAEAYWSSDNSGFIDMPNEAPSSGTWPYQMHEQNVIPLGSFEFVETTAPTGMLVDPTPHRCTIRQVGDRVVVTDVS